MKLADRIVRDTARWNPRIRRYDDGDILLLWSRPLSRLALAGQIGIEPDMLSKSHNDWVLHVPCEIANSEVSE